MPHSARGATRSRQACVLVLLVVLGVSGRHPAAAAEPPRLERATVPAAGRATTRLEVPDAGRYAISVESRQGVALRVVDRMSGPGEPSGAPGERDGRVDLFLDRGEVRLLTEGAPLGRGEARLEVRRFAERHLPPPRLVELRAVAEELGDFEQLSWWLDVPERRTVVLHAAGRHLADLRLWQNGSWLVDAAPEVSTLEPTPGRPLALCRLAADLGPGLYLLTAYGGPARPWSAPGTERPFHLVWGDEARGPAGRERRVMGPLGFQRLLVPASADYLRAELEEPGALALETADWAPEAPFPEPSAQAEITRESLPPVAELRRTAGAAEQRFLVTVRAAPGTPYVLQHFAAARRIPIPGRGPHWVASLHSGPAADSIDAAGVLVAVRDGKRGRAEPVAARVPVLDETRLWARRFNLLAPATLYLRVESPGDYELSAAGAAAEFRLEPLLLDLPPGYRPPPARRAPASWTLERGYHLLTLTPLEPGIVEVALRRRGLLDPLLLAVGLGGGAPAETPVRAAVGLGRVVLEPRTSYELWLNEQPGVTTGGVLRELPLDLTDPLPLSLEPGETVELPFRAAQRGALAGADERGTPLELSLDGVRWAAELEVPAGEAVARVRSTAAATVAASVGFVAEERRALNPLPPLSLADLSRLPVFTRLASGSPRPFDLARLEARTFEVEAPEAGLYVIETTGLLATEAGLRTRVAPRLVGAAENGSGRNAALRAYLRPGDYQVTVRARGESAGHLGVAMHRAALRVAGVLPEGLPARTELAPDEAVAYELDVREAGEYRLESLGLGRPLAGRFEDADGWPVDAPVLEGGWTLPLEPGRYRWIVLPRAVAARVVTRFERVLPPPRFTGHGPHPLPLDALREHVWREPEADGERAPDRWAFRLPASARVRVELDGEMEGMIVAVDGAREPVAAVRPGRGYDGELAAGAYELHARCSRVDNQVPYTVKVSPVELVDGLERSVALPAFVPVSIAEEAQVELESYGIADVRARLFDAGGRLLGSADDRPGDWNFLLARRLAPGRYRLEIEPVAGAGEGATAVGVRVRAQQEREPLAPGADVEVPLGDDVLLIPIELGAASGLLAAGARSELALGFELERQEEGVWTPVAAARGSELRLLSPLPAGDAERWRLRLWSLDRFPGTVALSLFAGVPGAVDEAELARGVELVPLAGFEPATAALSTRLALPGCFRLTTSEGDPDGLLAAPRAGRAFTRAAAVVTALERELWLAAPRSPGAAPAVAARRLRLEDRQPALSLALASGERVRCDIESGGAPAALRVSALAGAPLVAADGAGAQVALRATALAAHRALALVPAEARALTVWHGGERALEAELTLVRLAARPVRRAEGGELELELAPRELVPVALPAGAKRLRLTLGAGAAAAIGAAAAPESVHWAAEREQTRVVWSARDELAFFNPGELAARARVSWLAEAAPEALAPGAPFERRLERAESLRLELAGGAPAGSRLAVRGARAATLVGADGTVASGTELAVPAAGGALLVEAGPGFVAAWLEPGASGPALFGFGPPPAASEISPPVALSLRGREAAFRLTAAAPALLSLRSAAPMAVALAPDRGAPRFELYPAGAAFDAVLPAGGATLRLRALGDGQLAGTAELALTALERLGEGLGAPTLLAPGDARGFEFEVARAGPVGVGVAAPERGVETVAFDADGRPLGRGVVQWLDLAPGRYALVLVADADAAPAEARPALVGADAPGTGPAPEIVLGFLALERGAPAPAAGIVGEESPRRFDPERAPEPGGRGESESESGDGEEWQEDGEEWDEGEPDSEGGMADEGGEGE